MRYRETDQNGRKTIDRHVGFADDDKVVVYLFFFVVIVDHFVQVGMLFFVAAVVSSVHAIDREIFFIAVVNSFL